MKYSEGSRADRVKNKANAIAGRIDGNRLRSQISGQPNPPILPSSSTPAPWFIKNNVINYCWVNKIWRKLAWRQARCISDVKADTDHTSFLTGTLSLKEENEVHLIRLSSDANELICEGLFSHPNEIWDLASCPFDPRIFSTVFSSGNSSYYSITNISFFHLFSGMCSWKVE